MAFFNFYGLLSFNFINIGLEISHILELLPSWIFCNSFSIYIADWILNSCSEAWTSWIVGQVRECEKKYLHISISWATCLLARHVVLLRYNCLFKIIFNSILILNKPFNDFRLPTTSLLMLKLKVEDYHVSLTIFTRMDVFSIALF